MDKKKIIKELNKISFETNKINPICNYEKCKNKVFIKFKGVRPKKMWLCKKHYKEEIN